jgi:predicted amidohydrolase
LRSPASSLAASRQSTSFEPPRAICPRRSWPAWRCPPDGADGKPAFNAAVLIDRGNLLLEQHKRLLPFYDVFDEQRYFSPSGPQKVIDLDGTRLAITICEDAWNDKNFWPRRLYSVDPVEELMRQSPRCISTCLPRLSGMASVASAARCSPPSRAATAFRC